MEVRTKQGKRQIGRIFIGSYKAVAIGEVT